MSAKAYRLNATAASLLGFLHERAMTGWEINETANERIGKFWSLTKSQVYRELQSLREQGMIAADEKQSRERQPYTVTPRGRQAFREWIDAFGSDETIRIPMLLAVSFARFIDTAQLIERLRTQRGKHCEQREYYESLLNDLDDGAVAEDARRTLSFGIRYETLTIEWTDETIAALEKRSEHGRD